MARGKKPPPDMAVTSSALFRLPLEIRLMIYSYLLHRPSEILISSNQFTRQRTSKGVCVAEPCFFCGRSFARIETSMSHEYMGCAQFANRIFWRHLGPEQAKGSEQAPRFWPALLRTCRLVHCEATSVLYRSNSFRFEDAAAPNTFRWSTDQAQASLIERVHVHMPRLIHKSHRSWESDDSTQAWWEYFVRHTFSLAQDFPHLKGITITLGESLAAASSQEVQINFELFAKQIYKLDWLRVIGLKDPKTLKFLHSGVDRTDDAHGRKGVQMEMIEYKECTSWKDAIIWWGPPGEAAPRRLARYPGDPPDKVLPLDMERFLDYTDGPNEVASFNFELFLNSF